MTYAPKYQVFYLEGYDYDAVTRTARFEYSFDHTEYFVETVTFAMHDHYDPAVLDRALVLAFVTAGISYYKIQPTTRIVYVPGDLGPAQARFFSIVYRDGLSQFIYENRLTPDVIARFEPGSTSDAEAGSYDGSGLAVLQSGGKDSLLLGRLLGEKDMAYTAVYMQQSDQYPAVIDSLGVPVRRFERRIDREGLSRAAEAGGLNGHVPVTYITLSYALVDAILHGDDTVLAAIGREGEEPHDHIDDYAVTHQWSKTWAAEQLLAQYVHDMISPDLRVGSPLREFSELKVAQLFVKHCWQRFGHDFSSCNIANYRQGHGNEHLRWCGHCPKCANSFLLFAAFIPQEELRDLFGRDLYVASDMAETFKGLLGIDGVMKPFECVGEVNELRTAYGLSQHNGYVALPFDVPASDFDYGVSGPSQAWASQMIQ